MYHSNNNGVKFVVPAGTMLLRSVEGTIISVINLRKLIQRNLLRLSHRAATSIALLAGGDCIEG